jgi:hypothetical protein
LVDKNKENNVDFVARYIFNNNDYKHDYENNNSDDIIIFMVVAMSWMNVRPWSNNNLTYKTIKLGTT